MNLFPQTTVPELIEEAHEILAKAKERFKPVATYALFSGGNDSTAMLRIVKDHVDAAVHIRTGIGIESTFDHVRQTCEAWRVPLMVLETHPNVYRDLVLGDDSNGFKGHHQHHLTYHWLKQLRLRDLQNAKTVRGERLLFISAIRQKESAKRRNGVAKGAFGLPDHEARRCPFANPLVKFTSEDLANIRMELEVPQCMAAALIHRSGECLCGAHAKHGTLEEIEYWFPEAGAYIRELEREAEKAGKPYCKWGHGKVQGEAKPVGPLCQGCELFPAKDDDA
jgi:3'-phosphoadenosine 5'-phosphosulfate sulfotransferase (PAPS reductase)/FAD synthetase